MITSTYAQQNELLKFDFFVYKHHSFYFATSWYSCYDEQNETFRKKISF